MAKAKLCLERSATPLLRGISMFSKARTQRLAKKSFTAAAWGKQKLNESFMELTMNGVQPKR